MKRLKPGWLTFISVLPAYGAYNGEKQGSLSAGLVTDTGRCSAFDHMGSRLDP
jgi:hypothetical protein